MGAVLKFSLSLITLYALSSALYADNLLVTQKNKSFSTTSLKAKVGDSVEFKNEDTVYHNIYSLSDTQTFDLGSFGPAEQRKVKLDKPGKVEVECAVHKDMKMTIEVK